MMDRSFQYKVKEQIKYFPAKPGVYLMHDLKGTVIYVGKAKNLKKRVSSYFRHSGFASPRLNKLVTSIADITTIRTETEAEAFIVEARLIRKYSPFFNVELKMGDRYPYIKITSERFPRIIITRNRQKDGATYMGPFISAGELRTLLKLIQRYFPLRTCNMDLDKRSAKRPCINYSIGRCPGPCCGKCGESEYRQRVDDIILLLRGNSADLVERLRSRMDKASSNLAFEEAARHRDAIRAIWKLNRHKISSSLESDLDKDTWEVLLDLQEQLCLSTIPWRIDGFDISHIHGVSTYGVAVVFEQGIPNPSLYRKFKIRSVEGIDDFRSIKETVLRRYQRCIDGQEPLPQLILIDGGPVQLQFAKEALESLQLERIPVVSIAKKEELLFTTNLKDPLRLSFESKALKLLQKVRDESHRFAITAHRKGYDRKLTRNALQDIPGIGKHKAAVLLSHFGSVKRIRSLPVNDIAAIEGIGPVLAQKIQTYLSGAEREAQ